MRELIKCMFHFLVSEEKFNCTPATSGFLQEPGSWGPLGPVMGSPSVRGPPLLVFLEPGAVTGTLTPGTGNPKTDLRTVGPDDAAMVGSITSCDDPWGPRREPGPCWSIPEPCVPEKLYVSSGTMGQVFIFSFLKLKSQL